MVESWWWTMNILPEWMFVLLALSARLGQGRPASNYSEGRASHSFYTTLGHLKLQGTHRESLHTLHTSHNVPVWENDDISSDKTVGGEGQVKTDTITADLSLLSTQARNCKQELRAGSKTLVQSWSKTRSNQYLITRILFQNRALLGVMLQPAMTGGGQGDVAGEWSRVIIIWTYGQTADLLSRAAHVTQPEQHQQTQPATEET